MLWETGKKALSVMGETAAGLLCTYSGTDIAAGPFAVIKAKLI